MDYCKDISELLRGRSISYIHFSQDFFIGMIPDNFYDPPVIRLQLYSNWYVGDLPSWLALLDYFGSSIDSIRACKLVEIKENETVEIFDKHEGLFRLIMSNGTVINIPIHSDHTEIAWRIDYDDDANYKNRFFECENGVIYAR